MVDREARRKYAELVRQFISGRMNNEEYEERLMGSEDAAISEIQQQVWGLYDDLETHRMTGKHHLDRDRRRTIAQAILFLQSDREYLWPQYRLPKNLLYLVFTASLMVVALLFCSPLTGIGLFAMLIIADALRDKSIEKQWQKVGDPKTWPFLHQTDLDEAKRHPKLLNGKHTMP